MQKPCHFDKVFLIPTIEIDEKKWEFLHNEIELP